ncbi:hypothetical protein [Aliikangiella maris]|uniref:Prolow-density lipoprotein receptor-related protein 1-like beta-propeller domain-containing protein n=2 Tax=Aliikangiella maris TaxID=3162458 RepID=A0ABV3MR10_9GAMM
MSNTSLNLKGLLLASPLLLLMACGGGGGDAPTGTTKPIISDTTPETFSIEALTGVALNTQVESVPITITGIDAQTPISIVGGSYQIDGGSFTEQAGNITNNQRVVVRLISAQYPHATTSAVLNVGGLSAAFSVTTNDPQPDNFVIAEQRGVERNALISSAPVTVTGIDVPTEIQIQGGSYRIDNGEFTDQPGMVSNNQQVVVRLAASDLPHIQTSATLDIGGISADFKVTTNDPVPETFEFVAQSTVELNKPVKSEPVTITGIDIPTSIQIVGGLYSIDGGEFTDVQGMIENNQQVVVRLISSTQYATESLATLSVGEISADFSVTTTALNAYYFVGNTKESGQELWKSDGTQAGTTIVKEINTIGNSSPSQFTELGNQVFFVANDSTHGVELWKSDASGTALVKDIHLEGDSNPQNLTVINNTLYFTASDVDNNQALWKTDGSDAGTVKVNANNDATLLTATADNILFYVVNGQLNRYDGSSNTVLQPDTAISNVELLTAVGNQVYFSAYTSAFGQELWHSDGTNAGTQLVKDIRAGSAGFFNRRNKLYSVNGRLIISTDDGSNRIYVSDGTEAGTTYLVSNDPTPIPIRAYIQRSYMHQHKNSPVFFLNMDASYQLWQTDGTPEGTKIVNSTRSFNYIYGVQQTADNKNIMHTQEGLMVQSGESYFQLSNQRQLFTTLGNNIVYLENNSLKISDGASAGETVSTLEMPNGLALYAGAEQIYFAYDDSVIGVEPWVSDGTQTGTVNLADINKNPNSSSSPNLSVVYQGQVYFTASDGKYPQSLWRTDGTDNGTVRVTPDGVTDVRLLTVSNGRLFFVAENEEFGREIWVSDGTQENTHLFYDFSNGSANSSISIMQDIQGELYFSRNKSGVLMKTCGTVDSIEVVSPVVPTGPLYPVGDLIYFSAYSGSDRRVAAIPSNGHELWVTDGTLKGTRVIKDINPDGDSVSANLIAAALGNNLYYVANDGVNGDELWKTDGTEEGTQMVIDLNATENGLDDRDSKLFTWNNQLFMTAFNEFGEFELWKSDGTTEGTLQLTNYGENDELFLQDYAIYNDELYFSAYTETSGTAVWKMDAINNGLTLLKAFNLNGYVDMPRGFYVFNDILFFQADDGEHGMELWKTDGSEAGTQLVKDINIGVEYGANCLAGFGCENSYLD